MAKILKPDLSKPCLLCRFEISILIPEERSKEFDQHAVEVIKELKEVFGGFTPFFIKTNEEMERPDRMRIEILAKAEDNLECDKFFSEKVPVWKQRFGPEKIIVLMSNVQNWA